MDLYSCFPSAVQIAAAELGLPVDDPARPLTVTGGLTFGGGPGNNYGTHAVASMVGALRADPGSLGLVTGLGWYLTKHSVGVYGTEPPSAGAAGPRRPPSPRGPECEAAAGFAWADPQAAVGALPQCSPDADADGEVTVETYSVAYGRGGVARAGRGGVPHPGGSAGLGQRRPTPTSWPCWSPRRGAAGSGTLRPDGQVDLVTWPARPGRASIGPAQSGDGPDAGPIRLRSTGVAGRHRRAARLGSR